MPNLYLYFPIEGSLICILRIKFEDCLFNRGYVIESANFSCSALTMQCPFMSSGILWSLF